MKIFLICFLLVPVVISFSIELDDIVADHRFTYLVFKISSPALTLFDTKLAASNNNFKINHFASIPYPCLPILENYNTIYIANSQTNIHPISRIFKCQNMKEFCYIGIYTNLYQLERISIKFKLFSAEGIEEKFFTSYMNKIYPWYYAYRHFPSSKTDGQKYYPYYNKNYHKRGLAFYDIDLPIVPFFTAPRSGTHIISYTLSNILNEFISLFIGSSRAKNTDTNAGEVRGSDKNIRLSVSHRILNNKISIPRAILVFRSPLEALDSFFHAHLHFGSIDHSCLQATGNPGYEKLPEFKDWFENALRHFKKITFWNHNLDTIKYYIRFEDILSDPSRTFCDVITYIEGIPCKLSHEKRIHEILSTRGLESQYSNSSNLTKSKKRNLYKDYPTELIELIIEHFQELIHFYDYTAKYETFIKQPNEFNHSNTNYKTANNDTLTSVLLHKVVYNENASYGNLGELEINRNISEKLLKYRRSDCTKQRTERFE